MDEPNLRTGERPYLKLVYDKDCALPEKRIIAQKEKTRKSCQHKAIYVDSTLRCVTCQTCGETLDPVQCLIDLAHDEKELDWRVETIRAFEKKEAEKRKKQEDRQRKPMKELLGSESDKFKPRCGYRVGRAWVEGFVHRETGACCDFSKDGRFWMWNGNEYLVIDRDAAKQRALAKPAVA